MLKCHKLFSLFSSGAHLVVRSRTVSAILEEGMMWSMYVKLFYIVPGGSGDVKKRFLLRKFYFKYGVVGHN